MNNNDTISPSYASAGAPSVAVVILNWNGEQMMQQFLPSVVENSPQAAVIVADNGSTDNSLAMLHERFPSVRTIALEQNYGFAEGYNQALSRVETDYFVLLNSDVEVTPGWLQPLLDFMESHPEAAACQPKLKSFRERSKFEYAGGAGGYLDRYGYPFCRGRVFGIVEEDTGQYDSVAPLLWATGAALLIRRKDWLAAGGLDGRFFAHMEEIDLCWRLRTRGRGIFCVPQSEVYHVGGATLNAGHPRKTFLNFRNNLLMLYKNLPEEELRPVLRRRALLDYIAAAKLLVSDGVAHARAVIHARREFRRIKRDFLPQREENLRRRTIDRVPERMQRSLLVQFYLFGRKTFSALAAFKTQRLENL